MPDILRAGISESRGREKETHRQKLPFSGTDSSNAFRSRRNSEDHKNQDLKVKYNVKILVYRSDRIPVANESFFYQERKKLNEKNLTYFQLWWHNMYIGVPVVHSSISIPEKPKGQGTYSSCFNKAKMRPNSSSSHLLQSWQQDRRRVTK